MEAIKINHTSQVSHSRAAVEGSGDVDAPYIVLLVIAARLPLSSNEGLLNGDWLAV